MTLRQLLLIIRARWKTVLATVIVMIGLAVSLNFIFAPRYKATTTVLVDYKGTDPILGMVLPAQSIPGYMGTQLQIIQSHKVALEVVRKLKLASNPLAREEWKQETGGVGNIEDWLADLLGKRLDVKPARDSRAVDIIFTGVDPHFAALVADTFAEAYQKTNLELRVDPSKQAALWFDEQIRTLKANFEKAQSNLIAYQKEKGIVATDDRFDVENSRLSELSGQMVVAQTAAYDAASRMKQLNDFVARGADPANLPDILANALLQSMKGQLTQGEARLNQISSQLGANHPDVQRLRADIATQKQKIRDEIGNVGAGIRNSERIAQRREAELRQAVAVQKSKLLKFNESRDELAVLMREADSAQKAYDAASQRYVQQNLESQANQTSISVLDHAVPPMGPSFPKITLNVAIAIVLGTFLGINLAVVRELMDRRIRSEDDCVALLECPVLVKLDGVRLRKGRARLPRPSRRERKLEATASA